MWLLRAAGWFLAQIVRVWIATYRVRLIGASPPSDRALVFAFFHGRQMGLLRYPRPTRVAVLTSYSRDGTLQSFVLRALDFDITRGSSSKGGARGLVMLLRHLRRGRAVAIAVDGPKGPYGFVHSGAAFLAGAAKGVIIPVSCAARPSIRLSKSWDRFMIPLPWSRVVIARGEPIEVSHGPEGVKDASSRIERSLKKLEQQAETFFPDT